MFGIIRREIGKFGKIRIFDISGRKVRIVFGISRAKSKMMGIYLEKNEKVWHKDKKFEKLEDKLGKREKFGIIGHKRISLAKVGQEWKGLA
jgi:hypothetical protein